MTTDPVVRYMSAFIIATAFLACIVIVIHGYWATPGYVIPDIIAGFVGGVLLTSASLLGVHVGSDLFTKASSTVTTQQQQAINQVRLIQNGGTTLAGKTSTGGPDGGRTS